MQDFSENLKIEVKMEVRGLPMCFPVSSSSPSYFRASPALYLLQHQSKYYCTVSVTLFGAVATFHVDDVRESHLGAGQRKILKDKGAAHISVTFAYISDDNRHNQAFVQHVNKMLLEYVTKHIMIKPPTCSFIRSDGAPTQFANATQFYWIGRQHFKTGTRMCWSIHCTCHGKDKVDPEMGWMKNLIRDWMMRENLNTMAEVRLRDYKDVAAKLIELGACTPGSDGLAAGGIYKREIVTVPAFGPGSAVQDIPKGDPPAGAQADRQFIDQCCDLERGESPVLMRHRSCHFCDCCLRLDPADRANLKNKTGQQTKGPNPCAYQTICGDADNVVPVRRKVIAGTKDRADKTGGEMRQQAAQSLDIGDIAAFWVKSESEPWCLGRVLKSLWKSEDSGLPSWRGQRRELIHPNREYFTVQKIEGGVGSNDFFYEELEGDEGVLVVPGANLIKANVNMVKPRMLKREKEKLLGNEYWEMCAAETRILFASQYLYLPQCERQLIWQHCPQ